MINVSNEWKALAYENQKFLVKANITFKDGTTKSLTGGNFVTSSVKFDDATSANGSFTIGSAITNKFNCSLNNYDGDFDGLVFDQAVVTPYIGKQLSSTIEWIKKGVFTVEKPTNKGTTIPLVALDNMSRFDKDYDSTLAYPATLQQIITDACTNCGVILATTTFDNGNYVISTKPTKTTYRQVVAWAAQLACKFARFNVDGALELKWYNTSFFETETNIDGGYFDSTTQFSYQSGESIDGGDFSFTNGDSVDGGTFDTLDNVHHIYRYTSPSICTDDVVITGIKVVVSDDEYYQYGTDGYVLEISGNSFIESGKAQTIATYIGQKVIGIKFRSFSVSALADPTIEAGDIAYLSDKKQNTYLTLITNTKFSLKNYQSITCDAETPSENSAKNYSEATQALIAARKYTEKKISSYDQTAQNMTNLISAGFGLYPIVEPQEDGSNKYYMADKPTLAESSSVWTWTSTGLMKSTDGGINWGVDTYGNMLVNVLTAMGINADWINTGALNLISAYADLARIMITGGEGTGWINHISALGYLLTNTQSKLKSALQAGGWFMYDFDGVNDINRTIISRGSMQLYDSSGTRRVFLNDSYGGTLQLGYGGGVLLEGDTGLGSFSGPLECFGDFHCYGTKYRVVKTDHYGYRAMSAYETPKPMFADMGTSVLDNDGIVYIDIDDIFYECIDHKHEYYVHLTKYGQGDLWVDEIQSTFFVVKGKPDLKFNWKVEAVQRDYNTIRSESTIALREGNDQEIDYTLLASQYLAEYEKELII